ncbi:MAG: hypothetical protein FWD06_09305 [Oscillospiraceae bacterium]|nr:hypothetical protein [Oscillospiraceae bacterium]
MEELRNMEIIVYPYAEVKETLDKLARETAKRAFAELADKYAQEQAA